MAQIPPVICTVQQVADYQGWTAGQLAAPLSTSGGPTTLTQWIQNLMLWTATLITSWLDRDFTNGQFQYTKQIGNGQTYMRFPFPIATINMCKTWDPLNPAVAQIDDSLNVAVLVNDIYTIYRTDSGNFSPWLWYFINFTQAADPSNYNSWPQDIIQVQIEMIAVIYRESANFTGTGALGQNPQLLGFSKFENYLKASQTFEELTPRWKDRIRTHRIISI